MMTKGRVERTPPVFRSALCSPLLSPFGLESVTVFDPAPLCVSPSQKPACGITAPYVLEHIRCEKSARYVLWEPAVGDCRRRPGLVSGNTHRLPGDERAKASQAPVRHASSGGRLRRMAASMASWRPATSMRWAESVSNRVMFVGV